MAGLVYHAGALGDFITTIPAITRFRSLCPRLVLLGRPEHGALVPSLFEEVWDAAGSAAAGLFSDGGLPAGALADRLSAITSALVYARASSPLPAALGRLGVREVLRQDPFPDSPVSVVDYHLQLFAGPFREADRVPRIAVPQDAGPQAGIALAFGSGSAGKNWPIDRFHALASRLEERGERVSWVAGPAEAGRGSTPPDRTWQDLPLTELARRLSRCRLFVGNDSGVSHLAAAAGCPTIALFGPSDPRVWAPRGPRVTVIASPDGTMDGIPEERVLERCLDLLGER